MSDENPSLIYAKLNETSSRSVSDRPTKAAVARRLKPGIRADIEIDSEEVIQAKLWLDQMVSYARWRNEIISQTKLLTPALAIALLDRNAENRSLSFAKIVNYAADIKSGAWQLNGEPIIIAITGEMNDGQHRCQAVLYAMSAVKTQITFGVSRESRTTVDLGLKRTVGHMLAMTQHQNTNQLAHAATTILSYKRHNTTEVSPDKKPTAAEVLAFIAANPKIQDSITPAGPVCRAFRLSRGMVSALHFIFSELDADAASLFFDKLASGDGLDKDSPILRLRAALQSDMGNKRKLSKQHIAAFIIKAWNYYHDGRELRAHLQWRREGTPEAFPIAH